MEESSDRTSSVMSINGINNNKNSDSGYGSNSNKSNSQSQRSSGSSKSHPSSLSSSGSYASHPGAPAPTTEQHATPPTGSQGSTGTSSKRSEKDHKRKKKSKAKSTPTAKEPTEQRLATVEEVKKNVPEPATTSQPINPPTVSDASQQVPAGGPTPPSCDSKALQMAALSHALSCIKKFRDQDLDLNEDSGDDVSADLVWTEHFERMKDELNWTAEQNSFGAIVSMDDGLVIYVTDEISQILGYPKDMWMGRSFMDLVHPKDKMAFASQFTFSGGMTFPAGGDMGLGQKGPPQGLESFFCRLRQYRGLKSTGFGVADKAVVFFPFRLTLKLTEIEGIQKAKTPKQPCPEVEAELQVQADKKSVFLFIGATRITSAYQYPEEVPLNPEKFFTRHSATCQFGQIDPNGVKFLGHLPQDVVGQSVLDYYHPDDMLLLRDIYEGVMAERGKPFKSKPYRFRVFNGTFATLETDWSCFINPWSWKLEFVIGQHKVVKGPLNPNVFMAPKTESPHVEEIQEVKMLQEQIKHLLAETVNRKISEPMKLQNSRRKKDLAVLLETLLEQIGNNETSDQSDSVGSTPFSVMERDSAMLGEISPHHDDHSGSNQSSETPPSYNQLNYRENIERFFLSQPKTTRESDESGDAAAKNDAADPTVTGSTEDDESKGSPNTSSDSANRQSGSQGEQNESSIEATSSSELPCSLTEDTLLRHNENMEKFMIQRHRESRGRNTSLGSNSQRNCRNRLAEAGNKNHQLKRTGNLAGWASSGSSRKAQKQPHMEMPSTTDYSESVQPEPVSSINLWPPYSVAMTQTGATPTYTAAATNCVPMATMQYVTPNPQPTALPPNLLPQQPSAFVSVPNHYFPQQRVAYGMPGLGNIFYQSLGSAFYGQHGGLYTPTQPIIMGAGGPPLIGPGIQAAAPQLLPTVPGAIHPMGLSAPVAIRPSVFRPGMPPLNPAAAPIQLNPVVSGPPQRVPLLIPTPPVSASTSFTNSMTPSSSHLRTAVSHPSSLSVVRPAGGGSAAQVRPTAAVLHSARHSKEATLQAKRISALKAPADFSSSDGFGDSSSSSLYSLCKNGPSDLSNSPSTSREDKDSYDSPEGFPLHSSDVDQDMMWINHVEKSQDCPRHRGRYVPKLSKIPPWQQNVKMTPELSFRYQITVGDMSEVLQRDLDKLKIIGNQPSMVDEQLGELYNELKLEGGDADLNLEEGSSRYSTSPSSSENEEEGESNADSKQEKAATEDKNKKNESESKPAKKKLTRADYDKMVQVFEENAPFPKAAS